MKKTLKVVFSPLAVLSPRAMSLLFGAWAVALGVFWFLAPTVFLPKSWEVWSALANLWTQFGLGRELFASLTSNLEAIGISLVLSLTLSYLSVIPIFRPPALAISKLRFLGLVGLLFLFQLATGGGHALKLSLLVFGLSVFYTTSLLHIVNSIPKEEFDHARTLRMSNLRTVIEVVVFGRFAEALEALRNSAAIGWVMLTSVEGILRSEGGVGALLINQDKHFHLAAVFAIQLAILSVGIVQDYTLGFIRKLICPWVKIGLEAR